jgi:hydroxymethylglutaryl-CoA synthase
VWRTTDAIADYVSVRPVKDQLAAGRDDLPYTRYLTWRGILERQPPRRPEPDRAAAPPSYRSHEWKYALIGSREESGFVHLPPARVGMNGEYDQMTAVRMADVQGTLSSFTIDRLAYSISPPIVAAVVDFDGQGRVICELTDVDPDELEIGARVEMTFRRLYTSGGIHNYFWKARPVARAERASHER